MRRYLTVAAIVCLCLSTVGLAEVNHQLWWEAGLNETTMIEFHADKMPGMDLTGGNAPDIEAVLPDASFDIAAYNDGTYQADHGAASDPGYTANLWGWVTVPESGDYIWHIAADDNGCLYVADTMDDIAANYGGYVYENPTMVASVDGWAGFTNWTSNVPGVDGNTATPPRGQQTSEVFTYTAGQVLALYAYMNEGTGGDHLNVAWTPPGGAGPDPAHLSANITNIPPVLTEASGASPAVGATDVPSYSGLAWRAGNTAATHNVYLSTSVANVNDRNAAALVSEGQTGTSFDPDLALATTYYWAVDEVESAPGFTVHSGKVWSFTVEPVNIQVTGVTVTASSEFNADSAAANLVNGSGLTDGLHGSDAATMWLAAPGDLPSVLDFDLGATYTLDTMVVWNQNQLIEGILGFGSKDVVVETSTDGENWNVVEGATLIEQGPGLPDYAANTTFDMGGATASQVRVTITSGHGFIGQVGLSEVRFTFLPVAAREPQPADGSIEADLDTILGWRGGRGVASHQVVFSDVIEDVATNSAVVGTTDVDERSFDLSGQGLTYSSFYFWKIIEVGDGGSFESPVWSFQAPSAAIVDDFETYADEEGREIWAWWVDGFDNPDNGGLVGTGSNGNEPEGSIVSHGSSSLPLDFDNTAAAVSEATRTFSPAVSLTDGAPTELSLDVRGLAPAFDEDADGNIVMSAAGADIWNTADEFRFAYKRLSGDGSITARVNSHTVVHDWSKVGVMIRESASPDSANAFFPISGVNGARFQARTATFIASVNDDPTLDGVQQNIARDEPVWLRIERSGNSFTGSYTLEDTPTNWTVLGTVYDIPMVPNILIGLAITSHNVGNTVTGFISDVSTTGNVTGAWTVEAIGGVHEDGSDADSMYVTLTSGNQSVTFTHPDPAITQAASFDTWSIPIADIGFTSLDSMTVGVGTPGGAPSGATGTAFVDYIRVGTSFTLDEISLEAEAADTLGASWRLVDDPDSSGGQHIGSEDGDGNDNDFAPGADWTATYSFNATGGQYRILLRAQENGSDSFWVRITTATGQTHEDPDQPGTGWVRFNGIEAPDGWAWDEVHSNDHGNTVVNWTLTAGAHVLEIAKREDGTLVDAIWITNDSLRDQSSLPDTLPGGNLLTNGNFETGDTTGWNVYGDATLETVQDPVSEGAYALRVEVNSAGANFWDAGLQHQGHVFEEGKSYTVSAFMKAEQGTFQINFKPERGESPWEAYGEQQFTLTEEWVEYTVATGVIPAEVTPATITMHIAFEAGVFFIDDVRFYEAKLE